MPFSVGPVENAHLVQASVRLSRFGNRSARDMLRSAGGVVAINIRFGPALKVSDHLPMCHRLASNSSYRASCLMRVTGFRWLNPNLVTETPELSRRWDKSRGCVMIWTRFSVGNSVYTNPKCSRYSMHGRREVSYPSSLNLVASTTGLIAEYPSKNSHRNPIDQCVCHNIC